MWKINSRPRMGKQCVPVVLHLMQPAQQHQICMQGAMHVAGHLPSWTSQTERDTMQSVLQGTTCPATLKISLAGCYILQPYLPSPEMAAGCSSDEVQDHRSAAWRQGVRARLAKKATFEAAVADLGKALRASPAAASDPAIAELIERSFTLLRTRYTAPGFWSAGRALYASAAEVSQLASSLLTYQLWHGTCQTLVYPSNSELDCSSAGGCGQRQQRPLAVPCALCSVREGLRRAPVRRRPCGGPCSRAAAAV